MEALATEARSNMAPYETQRITRRDVARTEIDTSVKLLFEGGEPVPINVLTWAAVEVLRGVADHAGVVTFQATLQERVKPQHRREWQKHLKDHYNFSKHADRDPERAVEDFRSESVTWALFGACFDYARIFQTRTWAMFVYQHWFFCRHPNIAEPPMTDLLPTFAVGFDHPKDKPFSQSMVAAAEILREGARNRALMKQMLGPSWEGAIEW